jgi:hypothetical protein
METGCSVQGRPVFFLLNVMMPFISFKKQPVVSRYWFNIQ